MQGTLHRLLLEERQGELKPGAVLLLKQVGGSGQRPPPAPGSELCPNPRLRPFRWAFSPRPTATITSTSPPATC